MIIPYFLVKVSHLTYIKITSQKIIKVIKLDTLHIKKPFYITLPSKNFYEGIWMYLLSRITELERVDNIGVALRNVNEIMKAGQAMTTVDHRSSF